MNNDRPSLFQFGVIDESLTHGGHMSELSAQGHFVRAAQVDPVIDEVEWWRGRRRRRPRAPLLRVGDTHRVREVLHPLPRVQHAHLGHRSTPSHTHRGGRCTGAEARREIERYIFAQPLQLVIPGLD